VSLDWYPGIKAFCSHWAHAPMLQQTLASLDEEWESGNDASIDAAKSIVECACRIIIEEADDPAAPLMPTATDTSLGELLGIAIRLLELGEIRDRAFANLIREYYRMADALRVLRNESGTLSHGKDGFIAKLTLHHRRAALLAADAIVTFLHEAYLEREPDPTLTLEPYDRFATSNSNIDAVAVPDVWVEEGGLIGFRIALPDDEQVELTVEVSRLLFGVDREAYVLARNICREVPLDEPSEEEPSDA
jgi:hypothetical protein